MLLQAGGVATSIILSAVSASASRSLASMDARTIRTLPGKRWRNNSFRKEASVAENLSPKSCCIRRRSCDGLRSPRSSELNSFWSLLCSEAAVREMSCLFRTSYVVELGMLMIISRISIAKKRSDYVLKFCFLCCDFPGRKLCFQLGKPHLEICRPEWRDLQIDSCDGWR